MRMSRARSLLDFEVDAQGKSVGMPEIAMAIEKASEIMCDEQSAWIASQTKDVETETPFISFLSEQASASYYNTTNSSAAAADCPTLQAFGARIPVKKHFGTQMQANNAVVERALEVTRQTRKALDAENRRIGMYGAVLNEMTRFN